MASNVTTPPATRAAVILPWERPTPSDEFRAAEARLEEAVGLSASIGLVVVRQAILALRARRPATLFGSGQVEQLAEMVRQDEVAVLIVDSKLSPGQQRNLERALDCKVVDRTGLILDIFGARAATREGVLQVELAHLEYQRSRLVRLWTHLERQRGGFGFLGGPGETQMEADRRMLDERLVRLRKDLEQVRRTRGLHRTARRKVPFPVVALVGYTNAGKSTLFNALTGASVHAQDQLFATLDPTMRGVTLPSGRRIILSDTVGFISDLPTELVAAFRATLEEVAEADIILHVRDIAHPDTAAQRADVINVLSGMTRDGMLDAHWPDRCIEVLNKIDLLGAEEAPRAPGTVAISAITGQGLANLFSALDGKMTAAMRLAHAELAVTDGAALAWLYEHGEVLERLDRESGISLDVRLFEQDRLRFGQLYPECAIRID
ncbi:GTPase HflX [Acidomonas methanolica]|uniref:GTPase HflX n=1 Tax=Acidomonas methanolica NBRC 104435 TaxID=1231351 RepID=A0A023D4E1_ACIMT|nr:GTPase HflX [Acidomonas methanolica]MBU2654297.1 GTPase HflX [Acidomonas methanolica]TCS29264.1 GTP-binding protein HflX [Acidomonas methanolica]GAJ28939.1 GTP-binding GTPase HflX/HSR1 [Acidomonas methanolica NBRC 104435]GBQ50401.1 GTP-binding GTPase [Acidomonas methanolica]GEK99286.1 GTPase HflX [Acidomonas methanolica NBRC 104435]